MQDDPIRIPLRKRSGEIAAYALVDAADYERVAHYPWHRTAYGYAARNVRLDDGRRTIVPLHREVLDLTPGDGLEVDHKNRDKLDCRRSNLRVVTHQRNMCNVAGHRGSSSRFRGVWQDPRSGTWTAHARVGKKRHLGSFTTELEAAAAVNAFWVAQGCEAPNVL